MFEAPASPYLVPFDGTFRVSEATTSPETDGPRHTGKNRKQNTRNLNRLQRVLAAGDKHALLQHMTAARQVIHKGSSFRPPHDLRIHIHTGVIAPSGITSLFR